MKPVTRFYLSSFLKNQTYFTPILIIFLQAQTLDYTQIFWVFTVGSAVRFVMELPTGIIADFFGKRRSVIVAKSFIFLSFLVFGFAESFWLFVLAQSLFELGTSFRTGSETAYIYDYLQQQRGPGYTEVKGKQKFYARVGESIATAAGGVIASALGYSWVFFLAAIPAFLNILNVLSWPAIRERHERPRLLEALHHTKRSVCRLCEQRQLLFITLNITLFTGVLAALQKFIQPYMENVGIPIAWFGFIYAASLAVSALAVRYAYKVEALFGQLRTVNTLTLLAVVPALVIGLGYQSWWGVALFFAVIVIENVRSPVGNNAFHGFVSSDERATLGSVLSLCKSFGKMALLPLVGYLADAYSLATAVLVLAGVLLVNGTLFYLRGGARRGRSVA